MWELYLLTRLGIIFPILVVIMIFATGVLFISVIDIAHDGVGEKNRMFFKRSAVALAISVLGIIFIPTREDMLLIYGVGTTLDYLQDNVLRKMRNTTIVIIFAILVVLLVNIGLYSAAAFVNWEWNPSLWDAPTRFIIVIFSASL